MFVFLLSQKQRPKRVKAMYNCVADNPDELTFSEGDVIVVDGEEDQEWWVSILQTEAVHVTPTDSCLKPYYQKADLILAEQNPTAQSCCFLCGAAASCSLFSSVPSLHI